MSLMDKVNRYFETVSDEQLLQDLKESGFVIVPKSAVFRVVKTYSLTYSPGFSSYFSKPEHPHSFNVESGRVA